VTLLIPSGSSLNRDRNQAYCVRGPAGRALKSPGEVPASPMRSVLTGN
jgi:hypothetical protein